MNQKEKITNCLFFATFIFLPLLSFGQSHNYWTRSFNEESSLLSGAVVGGGAGPSAVYYNPSCISEVSASKFSLNASLFSFDFINIKNALGDGVDLNASKGNIEPRFISYMIKSKRNPNWSFEIAVLNNANFKAEMTKSVDYETDILTEVPGIERYFAYYQYNYQFRDDWIGWGGSVKVNDRLFIGAGMFITIKSLDYTNSLNIEAISLSDSVLLHNELAPSYAASYQGFEYLKFNDYRLTWKVRYPLQCRKHKCRHESLLPHPWAGSIPMAKGSPVRRVKTILQTLKLASPFPIM